MKTAIVIGASSGIGQGLAKLIVENGYLVGITGRRTELLEQLKYTAPDCYFTKTFDVSNTDLAVEKLEELTSELGGLDLLIISSGTGDLNQELDFDIDKPTIGTNITGWTCIANWTFTYFGRQKHGHLVAISSVGGLRGSRQSPSYNASKAYQINYLEGLRQKAANLKKPIYITDIRPGLVDTKMAKGDGLFWVMPVDKAVQQIYNAIKRKKKVAYVTKRWGFVAFILKRLSGLIYDRL